MSTSAGDKEPFELRNRRGGKATEPTAEQSTEQPEGGVTDQPLAEVSDAEGAAESAAEDAAAGAAASSQVTSVGAEVNEGGPAVPADDELDEASADRLGPWVWGVLAVAVLALVFGIVQVRSGPSESEKRADLRDQAMVQGQRALEILQTLDSRDIDAGVKRWMSVSTGVLHDQFAAMPAEHRATMADAGKVTKGTVVSAGLIDLKDTTATMLASTEVSVGTPDASQAPTVKRNRYQADLTLVNGTWKIEDMGLVAVTLP